MTSIRTLALAILLVLGAAGSAAALPALEGRLVDAGTGDAVAGATVLMPARELRLETDAEGRFTLPDPPAEPFTLVFSHLAYEPRVMVLELSSFPDATLTVELEPTYYSGEKVVVSASRYSPDVHLSQTNLTAEEVQARSAEKDLPLLLETTPGLYASQDAGNGVGYTYLKLRGFDQKRIGVMINGIPLNDPEDHQVYWVDMPDLAGSLEDVQVQRGVTNSLGGMSAIAGSVNLVTDVLGPEPGGQFSVAAGSFGTAKQSLGWQSGLLGGRFATGLRISHLASDGYRDRSGTDQWGAFWSGRFLTPHSATQMNVYTGRELTHQAWYGLSDDERVADRRANPETYANAVDDFSQPHYELHHRWDLRANLQLESSLYWIHGEGFYENFKQDADPVAYSLDTFLGLPDSVPVDLVRRKWVDKDQRGFLTHATWQKGPSRAIFGGDFYDFHSHHWGDLQLVEGFGTATAIGLPHYHDYTGDKRAWSAYVNEQFALGLGFTALADLHFTHKSYDFFQQATGNFQGALRNRYKVSYDFFDPKGGLHWKAPGRPWGGELGVYGHFGLAHREPADAEMFNAWVDGTDLGARPLFATATPIYDVNGLAYIYWTDPQVEAESVRDYELGLSWRGDGLSLSLDGYLMEFENEIVDYGQLNADGQGVRGNAEQTLHRGVELGLTADLDALLGDDALAGHQVLDVAFARSWDQFERFILHEFDGTRRNYGGNPIAGAPTYLGTFGLDSDWGPLRSRLSLRAVGRQQLDNSGIEARSIDPYQVMDVALTLDPAQLGLAALEGTTVELQLYNALDVEYATWGYYDPYGAGNYVVPAAKSHFLLGVRHAF